MFKDDEKLIALEHNKKRDDEIMRKNAEEFSKFRKSTIPSDLTEKAQEQKSKKEINYIYDTRIFPYTNAICYMLYYVGGLIVLPFVYKGIYVIAALFALISLFGIVIISFLVERTVRSDLSADHVWIKRILRFSDQTSLFCNVLTSIGYVTSYLSSSWFWFFYIAMVLIFIILFYFNVLKPGDPKTED